MPTAFDLQITVNALRDAAANRKRFRRAGVKGRGREAGSGPIDVVLCVVDHFEPQAGSAPPEAADRRLEAWTTRYPAVADRHRDSDGRRPPHSFFYPWDEYRREEMARLQELCSLGYGEIELHLHHEDDTEATLRAKIDAALVEYRGRGALSQWPDGRTAFGFIHGNWALDNSRQENGRNFCGVDSEIRLLRDLGCYADFTFPAWQHTAQPRLTNAIFYAVDDPARPKSHDRGERARVGASALGDLLLIQGPLAPNVERRGRVPRVAMDDGDLAASRRYGPERADRWVRAAIHVDGCGGRLFVKLHCHGAPERNAECLLGGDLDRLFTDFETRYNDGGRWRLHYVTAREMFNIVRATEREPEMPVEEARDYLLKPPAKPVDLVADRFVQPVVAGGVPAAGRG